MNHQPNPRPVPVHKPKRPDTPRTLVVKPKSGMSEPLKMALIAGGVIAAVFAGLELAKPAPEKPTVITL